MPNPNAKIDQNWNTSLIAVSTGDGETPVRLEADPITGALLISGTFSAATPTLPSTIINGQKAASTSAATLGTGALTQGVIIEALSTNTVSVFIGGSGVTASTGIELLPGGSTSVAVANISAIFIISASGTPAVSWIGS